MDVVVVQSLSRVQLFATQWTVAHQALLSMGFPRQEYWSGLPFPSPRDLPNPGIKPVSQALPGRFFITEPPGKPLLIRGLLSLKVFSDSLYNVLDATSRGHSGVFANVKCFGSFIRICRVPS